MVRFRKHYRVNRVVLLALALLVSNIATMSCAMAWSLCGDCQEQEPVLCIDSYATAEIAISDQSTDTKSATFRPILIANNVSTIDPNFAPGQFPIIDNQPPDPHSSPPLHLQLCVFLK